MKSNKLIFVILAFSLFSCSSSIENEQVPICIPLSEDKDIFLGDNLKKIDVLFNKQISKTEYYSEKEIVRYEGANEITISDTKVNILLFFYFYKDILIRVRSIYFINPKKNVKLYSHLKSQIDTCYGANNQKSYTITYHDFIPGMGDNFYVDVSYDKKIID